MSDDAVRKAHAVFGATCGNNPGRGVHHSNYCVWAAELIRNAQRALTSPTTGLDPANGSLQGSCKDGGAGRGGDGVGRTEADPVEAVLAVECRLGHSTGDSACNWRLDDGKEPEEMFCASRIRSALSANPVDEHAVRKESESPPEGEPCGTCGGYGFTTTDRDEECPACNGSGLTGTP